VKASSGLHAKRGFALMLARICPEKGVHLALDAAKQAGVPLLVAGQVFPYSEHRRYFQAEVLPRLDKFRRYIGPAGSVRKRRLLSAARCVLVASTVPETSSLVAREALAAGTPVIALARGALVDILEHGHTGFLVDDVAGMASAIGRSVEIDPEICRSTARQRFAADQMVAQYFQLYRAMAGSRVR
jgi:glycosyltransferase involved in cell wall biosynthesis